MRASHPWRRRLLTMAVVCLVTSSVVAQRQVPGNGPPPLRLFPDAVRLLLALDRLQANRIYPPLAELQQITDEDQQRVLNALLSTDSSMRQMAVRGIGRFENPQDIERLAPFLNDKDPGVRREAVNAIAQAASGLSDDAVIPVYRLLMGAAADAIEAIARLHYSHNFAQQLFRSAPPSAMLIMLRNDPKLELAPGQVDALLEMAKPHDPKLPASSDALDVLIRTHHVTPALLMWAAQFRCPGDMTPYPCSKMRELAVQQLNGVDDQMSQALQTALRDPWPVVRALAVRRIGDVVPATHDCGPLQQVLLGSELSMVKIEALSRLSADCEDRDAVISTLKNTIVSSRGGSPEVYWPMRAQAIERLAAIDQKAAREVLEQPDRDVWQVRAARARAWFVLRDREHLRELARDDHPNVRAEALIALGNLGDDTVNDLVSEALADKDYHLIQVATDVLRRRMPPPDRALADLSLAFTRLGNEQQDDARFARLAILYFFRDLAKDASAPSMALNIAGFRAALVDSDPVIASAVADVIGTATGNRPVPTPRYRPPMQPKEFELSSLPRIATISLDAGTIDVTLLPEEAPLTVARFVKLANAGYFRGQSLFYNLSPLAAVNGGSPNGNELSADARFLRDEIGFERNRAGMIGLLSHGRDTADGRLFIDLTDQRDFDYDYTLFARVARIRTPEPWPYSLNGPLLPSLLAAGGAIQSIRFGR